MAFAETTSLEKKFGDTPALRGVDLEFSAEEMTVILGPSGCGKTTLLRIIAGLEEPDRGQVVIGGRTVNAPRSLVPAEKRGLGMVFQDSLLWPHLTVRQNISFPLGSGKNDDPLVLAAAKATEIDDYLDRYPSALSGGEQRRVSIARAIVASPELLLFDEPLSGLDANLRVRLLSTIRRIQRERGMTGIYVTHDQEEALSLADRLVVMRDGQVLQVGTPREVYRRPSSAFVAGFVGLSNLLWGRETDGRTEIDFAGTETAGDATLLAARPESVHLGDNGGAPGTVVASSFRGDRWLVEVQVSERRVLSWSPTEIEAGKSVSVTLDPAPVPVLDDRRSK